jgi:DNA modification methylase
MKLKIACKGAGTIELDRMENLQGNLKVMSPDNKRKLRAAIEKEFSFPVFIWKKPGQNGKGPVRIIDGHQRIRVLHEMRDEGWEIPPIPVDIIKAATLKEAKVKLLQVLSQYGKMTQRSFEAFIAESDIKLGSISDLIMLPSVYLDELIDHRESDTNILPMPTPRAKKGDLWLLGKHRLVVGDAGDSKVIERLMAGATIQLLNTDPPYNVAVEPRTRQSIESMTNTFPVQRKALTKNARLDEVRRSKPMGKSQSMTDSAQNSTMKNKTRTMRARDRILENDWMSEEEYAKKLLAWFGNAAAVMDPGAPFYAWGGYSNCYRYPTAMKAVGLYFSQAIVWVKHHPVLGRKDYLHDTEWAYQGKKLSEAAFYGWREGKAHLFYGPNNQADVWEVEKVPPGKMVHLTEKPVELARRAIKFSSKRGDNVLDLFGGSGSTLIACEELHRTCYMVEIDTAYADVIISRWETLTGKKAKHG